MSRFPPYIGKGYRVISGKFKYPVENGTSLTFEWDKAAVSRGGSLIIVEEELSKPVPLHIQGHVARAAYMSSSGDSVQKLVWVVRREHFSRLWEIVESWRMALAARTLLVPPPCQYWTPENSCLAISRDVGKVACK